MFMTKWVFNLKPNKYLVTFALNVLSPGLIQAGS